MQFLLHKVKNRGLEILLKVSVESVVLQETKVYEHHFLASIC